MKKLIIIFLIIIAFVSNAQFYTDFNIGYNKSILSEIRSYDITQYKYNDSEKYYYEKNIELQKINVAEGIFISNEIGYRLKKRWGFSINTYYFNNKKTNWPVVNQVKNKKIYFNDTLSSYNYINNKFYSTQFRVTPQINMYFKISKLEYIVSLGFTFSTIKVYLNRNIKTDNGEDYNQKLTFYDKKQIKTSIVFSNSFLYKINNKIGLLAIVTFAPMDFFTGKTVQTSKTGYVKNNDTNKINYINDNKQQEIDNIFYFNQFGYSNINFSLGIRYTFGKKEKTETE